MELSANRIAFSKFYNCGQICIAVDYVLVPKERLNEFVTAIKKTVKGWYGEDPKKSKDFARIVNDRHVERLSNMLNNRTSGDIVMGGDIDKSERYISPTVVVNVKHDDPVLMGDEIFGPILPVITYSTMEEAIGLINKREPPLALYVFTHKEKLAEKGNKIQMESDVIK